MAVTSIFRPELFDGQVFLITGGGTGIGRAIARELSSLGASVAISSLADMEILYQDLPLDKITTSMTINSPSPASHTTSEKACAAQRTLHQQALQHDLSH
jgi:NAD(P)-dependent dehydrogenase (short-subunit alcohol dehydrogenase family)